MVAVCNKDGFISHFFYDFGDGRLAVNPPKTVPYFVFIQNIKQWFSAHELFEDLGDFGLFIAVQGENRFKVGKSCAHELEAVEFSLGVGFFVGKDLTPAHVFQAQHPEKANARVFFAPAPKTLFVYIKSRLFILFHNFMAQPAVQKSSGSDIFVVVFPVSRKLFAQVKPDKVKIMQII